MVVANCSTFNLYQFGLIYRSILKCDVGKKASLFKSVRFFFVCQLEAYKPLLKWKQQKLFSIRPLQFGLHGFAHVHSILTKLFMASMTVN